MLADEVLHQSCHSAEQQIILPRDDLCPEPISRYQARQQRRGEPIKKLTEHDERVKTDEEVQE
jgi:hypothetical protein